MSLRRQVKTAIQTQLQGTTGLKNVFLFDPKEIIQSQLPAVTVHLSKSEETRASASAPYGKKKIKFTATLMVYTFDVTNDGSGELDFDDLLDAIDSQLRKDPTFGGVVIGATVEFIRTNIVPPTMVKGRTVSHLAVKNFDILVEVTG